MTFSSIRRFENSKTIAQFVIPFIFAAIVLAFASTAYAQTRDQQLQYAKQLNAKHVELYGQGKYQQAAKLGEELRTIRGKVLGKEHRSYASSLHNLAVLYYRMGDYSRAEPLYLEAKKIWEKVLGKEHPDYATSVNSLAELYLKMGDYSRAEPLYLEAKKIREKVLGKEHRSYASSLHNLAVLYYRMGDYSRAEPLYLEEKKIREKVLGKEHPDYATSLNNLAVLYDSMGDYSRAEPLLLEATKIREKVLGKEHPAYAATLLNLAGLYERMGDYSRAEPLYLEAKKIREKVLGKEHSDYAISVNNLALLYYRMGDYSRAEPLYLEAKKIWEKVLGKEHPDYAATLHNLAGLYERVGDYSRAEPLYLEATKIREKVLGKEHPAYAASLKNLASLYTSMEDYSRAEPLSLEAKRIREKMLCKEHPYYAISLHNLAGLYYRMGDYSRAEPLYLEAKKIREKVLGKDHPDYAATLNHLGLSEFAQEKYASGFSNIGAARKSIHAHTSRLLPTLSRKRQATYLKENYRNSFEISMSAGLALSKDAERTNQSTEWLINGKSIGQEALASSQLLARDSQNPKLRSVVEKLRSTRQQLANLTLAAPDSGKIEQRKDAIAKLKSQVTELANQLAAATGQQSVNKDWVELATVQKALPANAALIELVQFDQYDFTKTKNNWQPARYAAWVIPPTGDVQIIDLGLASEIDSVIKKVNSNLADSSKLLENLQAAGEAETLEKLNAPMAKVAELVWKPIAAKLPADTKQLIISPDSSLWLLPWSALPTGDDRVLLEDYSIRLEVSGRYLVKDFSTNKKTNRPYIFADPDYDLSTEATGQAIKQMFSQRQLNANTRGVTSQSALGKVGRLPNTKMEAEAVTPNLAKIASKEPRTYSGKWAMETVLKAVKNPKVLMLATHGFFLPEQTVKPSSRDDFVGLDDTRSAALLSVDGKPIENPLLRCGLLFAGCNTGTAAGGDDGILTGMEVVGLDLRGTEMVVLSACETGIGDVNNGEGVAGLRQAFQLAGAQSVVATLWSVPDRDSAIIMKDFFTNLAAGQPRSEALRQAQLTRIKARRARHGAAHPFFWAAFTLTGQD